MRKVAVVTTGFFDGVHLGHRHVLETVVSAARERGEEAIVVTFWPHPRTVLQQDAREFRLLTSLEEKKALLAEAGIDRVEVLPFTREFAALKAEEYLQLLRTRFAATLIVMGYDNHIGSDRKTAKELCDVDVLKVDALENYFSQGFAKNQFSNAVTRPGTEENYFLQGFAKNQFSSAHSEHLSCHSEPSSCHSEHSYCHSERSEESPGTISSTKIRLALEEGRIQEANEMLGYSYGLYGVVVAGNRMGRTIGFPTANMHLYEPLKLVPGNGVYAVEVEVLGAKYKGMCNIGTRPTVGGTTRTIETHILDFEQDIYGLPMRLRFLRRIRDERKFPSLEALRAQLLEDRQQIRTLG